MVLWCRCCGALVGICYPYTDWAIDRDAVCPSCAEREHIVARDGKGRRLSEIGKEPIPEMATTMATGESVQNESP
jgi:hypothetical protein